MDPSQVQGLSEEDQKRMVAMIESMQTRDRCDSKSSMYYNIALFDSSSVAALFMSKKSEVFSSPLFFLLVGFLQFAHV